MGTPEVSATIGPLPDGETGRRSREPVLELREVRFAYPDGTLVLDGVSTSIERGTILGIVGPSGCGKTTLLYLIARLLQTSSGEIVRRLDDPSRHELSMVFQKDTLLPWLNVAENVRLFARFRVHGLRRGRVRSRFQAQAVRARAAELDESVQKLLDLAHLGDRADAYPYQLSGGMRRRLALLAGVAPHPHILLLDEPFSAVDEPTRIGIHQDVFDIVRRMGTTVVIATHDLAEAVSLCDRVVILSNRPVTIAYEHVIPFGVKREMLSLRAQPEFLEIYGRLWDGLSEQIARTAPELSL